MSFSLSLLELVLVPLTVTGIGGCIMYGSLQRNELKVNKSIVDPGSEKYRKTVEKIEFDDGRKETEDLVKKTLLDAVNITEKITRNPLKFIITKKGKKQTSYTFDHVLEPTGKDWDKPKIYMQGTLRDKKFEIKIWKNKETNECRYSWNWVEKIDGKKRNQKKLKEKLDKNNNCIWKGGEESEKNIAKKSDKTKNTTILFME